MLAEIIFIVGFVLPFAIMFWCAAIYTVFLFIHEYRKGNNRR